MNFVPDPGVTDAEEINFVARLEDRYAQPDMAGKPRSTPTFAPVAVSNALLGPGVPAATTAKTKRARACSGVI